MQYKLFTNFICTLSTIPNFWGKILNYLNKRTQIVKLGVMTPKGPYRIPNKLMLI